jgi:hypothetical protein
MSPFVLSPILVITSVLPIFLGGLAIANLQYGSLKRAITFGALWLSVVAISSGFWTYAIDTYDQGDNSTATTLLVIAVIVNAAGTHWFYQLVLDIDDE